MNLNCKLTLTDEQRNNIKRHLTGKDVKALAKRAEICQLIEDLLEPFLCAPRHESRGTVADAQDAREFYENQASLDFCSDDCCTRNDLLQRRVNILQHRLDTL